MGKPALKRKYLFVISGLIWSMVGLILLRFAFTWLASLDNGNLILSLSIGIILGVVISVFGLSKIANRNIKRINLLPEKPCMFAFQAWKNYLTVMLMITMGIFLRTSSLAPKPYLAIIYVAMGSALLFASFPYYSEYGKVTAIGIK